MNWRDEIRERLESAPKDNERILNALEVAIEYLEQIGELYDYEVDQAQAMAKRGLAEIEEVGKPTSDGSADERD